MRAPTNDNVFSAKRSQSSISSPSKKEGGKLKSGKKEKTQDKYKRAEMNAKYFFDHVKKALERSEDEFLFPGQRASVGKAKGAMKEKKLFRFLHS